FSRTQILKPEILNINQIISETIKMTRYMIGEDIQIILHLDSEIGFIKADPGQISQVLMNLLVNARDAMFEGGAINIKTQKLFLDEKQLPQDSAEKKGDYICLNVIDTGIGMDEKTLQNIFEPFFTTKDVGKGTGLGLATVYGIVEQSGGFINVESELGIGTTFKIFLPSVKEKPKIEDGDLQKEPARGKGTILIVEDEILVRNLTRDALRENGYDVIEAANGAEAFNLFEKKKIIVDLLITDIVMPRMSGYELVAKLKDHKPPLKVLFTSGYLEDERIKNASFDISHNFIQKPFQLKDLMLKIQEILASEDNHY
nr:response regulator [Pyrinomonadaceae bacterium]